MWHSVKLYVMVLVIFPAIDLTWLGVLMSKFYKTELGSVRGHTTTNYLS